MAQFLIHKEATTPAYALTLKLNVPEEKQQLPPYMPKCVRLNYSMLQVDDISAEKKAFGEKQGRLTAANMKVAGFYMKACLHCCCCPRSVMLFSECCSTWPECM